MAKITQRGRIPAAISLVLAAAAGNAQGISVGLEEVVVTAQKTSTDLQSTPISISAFSSEQLSKMGAFRTNDIAEYTPNLSIVSNTVSSSGLAISMRGISSTNAALGEDTKIGMYVDGVYIARLSASSFDVAGIDQIEVLRGPQGTLWGKNTTGGAVNIMTKKPTGEFGLRQLVSAGNRDYMRTNTQLNLPAWNDLSLKLSYDHAAKDGDIRNLQAGAITDLGEMDNNAYSVALRWTPSDFFTADYTYDKHDLSGTPPAFQLVAVNPGLAGFENASISTPSGPVKIPNPFNQAANVASSSMLSGFSVNPMRDTTDIEGHALHLALETESHLFKSITARRTYDGNRPGDFDGGDYSATLFRVENNESQKQFSQEFQVVSTNADSRWGYVAGLYYFEEETSVFNPQTFTVRIGVDADGDPLLTTLTNTLSYTTDNSASAAYIQGRYRPPVLDDKLEVSLGIRYTEDKKEAHLKGLSARGKKSWNSTNPSLILNYELSDDTNLYTNISTGYNSGQFNVRATTAPTFAMPVDEENVINYEVGVKSELFDRRMRLNGAIFRMDYTDLQVNQFRASGAGATSILTNAGEATITGFEVEALYLVNDHVSFNASWGYTHFKYDEFITSTNTVTGVSVDQASEAKPTFVPKNTGSAGIAFNHHLEGVGLVDARLDITYTSRTDFAPFLTQYAYAESRTLVNARVGLSELGIMGGDRSSLEFSLWGKNLTGEKYRSNGIDFGVDSGSLGYAGVIFGARRAFGVDIVYEFE